MPLTHRNAPFTADHFSPYPIFAATPFPLLPADAVLKGYATAVSVLMTGMLSAFFFSTELTSEYMMAMVIVACSIMLYNARDLDQNVCKHRDQN